MERTKIVCLTTTLRLFQVFNIFPKELENQNRGRYFYIKYIASIILGLTGFFGCLLHLIHTTKNNEYHHVDLDLSYILSTLGAYLLSICFFINSKDATKMYMFLSDFQEYGKPPKFDYFNERLNKLSKYHMIYIIFVNTLFVLASNIFRSHECEKENSKYGFNEICGLLTDVWLPFDIDYIPVKQIYLFLQVFSIFYLFSPAAIVTFASMETVLHIGVRLDHVRHLFVEALNEENPVKRREGFKFAARYHSRVLELETELNNSFAYSTFCLLILDAAILGCGASGFLKGGSPNPLAVCVAWFMGLSVLCVSGQHLINKSLSIGTAVYNTNWYNAEASLQKGVIVVLTRCLQPMYVRAAAFGIMNHATIVAVVQASFAYIRLLTGAAARDMD